MWIVFSAVYLAVAHIAGDNLAVVPDLAARMTSGIYITIIVAYIIIGSIIAGLAAWIGLQTGQELPVITKKFFGCRGKKIFAIVILAVSLPASALTGGYYSSSVLAELTGIPLGLAIPFCLAVYSYMVSSQHSELLKISNYVSLLLIPLAVLLISVQNIQYEAAYVVEATIDWLLVCALVAYNVGGMRPVLIIETAAHLSQKGMKAIYLVILAKFIEGAFTLAVAHLVVVTGVDGPLALSRVVEGTWGLFPRNLFDFILLCVFLNTMVPAMLVNAKQISVLTGLKFQPALIMAGTIVCLLSYIGCEAMLKMLGYTGLLMIVFIIYTAVLVHKSRLKQP